MATVVNECLSGKQIAYDEVPMVDIGPLLDGSDPEGVAREIGHICEHIGFLYVRNHGVPRQLVQDAYAVADEFFALPFEEKNRLNVVHSGPTLRGYIPIDGENVDPEHSRDIKECFDFGQDEAAVSPFFGPNPMPERPERFKAVMEAYHDAMLGLSRKLTEAIARSLDLPPDYFARMQRHPITVQRVLHYPPQRGEIRQDEIGIGAHTDYGFLTILAQDDNGGLQVRNRAGEWIDAPPIEDTFVVNIGDLVQTLTNDRYPSTLHRVINTSGRERYSLPFFIDMDFDAVVEPVPTCTGPDNPPRYAPYTCGEHKYARYAASYEHL